MSHKSSPTAFQYVFVASARDFQLNNGHVDLTLFLPDKKLIKELLRGLKSFEVMPQHDGLLRVSCLYSSGRESNEIFFPHEAAKAAGLFSPDSYINSLSLWVTDSFGRKKICERQATLRLDAKDPMEPMDANIPSASELICEQLKHSHIKSGDANHEASPPTNQSQRFEAGDAEKNVTDYEHPSLKICNSGPEILSTNFWDSDIARAGKFIVSVNAGHLRLLVPDNMHPALADMLVGADHVQITALPSDRWVEGRFCTQWLFEDFSESPFMLEFSPGNYAGLRPAWPNGDSRRVSFWIRRNGNPYCYAELPVRWTVTPRLKDLCRTQ